MREAAAIHMIVTITVDGSVTTKDAVTNATGAGLLLAAALASVKSGARVKAEVVAR
jgi:hypothetical protein